MSPLAFLKSDVAGRLVPPSITPSAMGPAPSSEGVTAGSPVTAEGPSVGPSSEVTR